MDQYRRRSRLAALVAATLCLVAAHEGRCGAAARPLRRLHAVDEWANSASEAVLDVAAAEAPEGVRWAGGGDEALAAGRWLPMRRPMPRPMPMPVPMALTIPAGGGLRFPPVSPGAGASMPWLPGSPPAGTPAGTAARR